MRFDAVIFDLFGTLVHNFSLERYQQFLEDTSEALSVPLDDFRKLWRETAKQRATGVFQTVQANFAHIREALGLPADEKAVQDANKARARFIADALRPRRDALETLSGLRDTGYKTGLVSNCSSDIPDLWNQSPFARLVDEAVFSSSVGIAKPDPRIFRTACERLEASPERCLYVGNGSDDELKGAQSVGLHPVLLQATDQGAYDPFPPEGPWNGPSITALKQVFALLE